MILGVGEDRPGALVRHEARAGLRLFYNCLRDGNCRELFKNSWDLPQRGIP